MHQVASLHYLDDVSQGEIAERLGTSRATVSRVLAEARASGMVRIEILEPEDSETEALADRLAAALDLDRVHLSGGSTLGPVGVALAPALSAALRSVGLEPGDVLLLSSGRTVYEAAQAELPSLPGVLVAPTVGGQDDPEIWYATNEITRQVALKVGGAPNFLYAPALPAGELYETLQSDPNFRRVLELWNTARCAVVGIGAPPLIRTSLPRFVQDQRSYLQDAVGDLCTRFYDRDGEPVMFPGAERLVATGLQRLRGVSVTIGLAAGSEKLPSILAAVRGGYLDQLVTDTATATALVELTEDGA